MFYLQTSVEKCCYNHPTQKANQEHDDSEKKFLLNNSNISTNQLSAQVSNISQKNWIFSGLLTIVEQYNKESRDNMLSVI